MCVCNKLKDYGIFWVSLFLEGVLPFLICFLSMIVFCFFVPPSQKEPASEKSLELMRRLHVQVQRAINGCFKINHVQCHQKYLGLPSFMPRNRCETLGFLKDRVRKLLEGWKGKLFSVDGRAILIKAVIQVIPCYTMNCL